MSVTWITKFILLCQPEDTSRITDERYSPAIANRSKNKKLSVSVKAQVWTVISSLFGLVSDSCNGCNVADSEVQDPGPCQ